MLPNQLIPLLYDDYLGIAREGPVFVPEPIVDPGQYVRIAAGRTSWSRQSRASTSYPRQSVSGGGYPRIISPVNNEAAILAAAQYDLFLEPWSVLADATSFITRFLSIIADNESVPASLLEYLLTEGNDYDIDEAPEGDTLDERHLLYWLDRKLKEHKAGIGYTNRLSEAGWGEAAPNNLTDADPLDLVTTLEGLLCNVAIIDPEAVDDGSAGSATGPVLVTFGGGSNNPCTLLDGTTDKTSANTGWLFTDGNKDTYSLKLWGVRTGTSGNTVEGGWDNLHEAGGGSSCRFPNSAKPCIVLTRYGDDHQIARELILRKPATHTAPAYIWLGGYPGEFPNVRMGSSVTGASVDTIAQGPQVWIGFSSTPRNDLHFRNMDFRGCRDGTYLTGMSEVAGRVFAKTMFKISGSVRCSSRYCSYTEFLPMTPAHTQAGSYPDRVDIIYSNRPSSNGNDHGYTAVGIQGQYFTFDRNYVKAAATDVSFEQYLEDYPLSRGTDCQSSYCTISRNTYEGFSTGDYVRCITRSSEPNIVGYHVHHNVITPAGYKAVLFAVPDDTEYEASIDAVFEYNFVYNWGLDGIQAAGGLALDPAANCGNGGTGSTIVRHNTFAGSILGQSARNTASFQAISYGAQAAQQDSVLDIRNVQHYGNIHYRAEFGIGTSDAWADIPSQLSDIDIYENIIHDLKAPRKVTGAGVIVQDAPITTNFTTGGLGGSVTLRDNNVTRPSGDTHANALLMVRTGAGTTAGTQYDSGDTLTGWTDTTELDPQFADPENGDFTVGNSTLAPLVALAPKTREAVGAWRPLGV